MTDSLPNPRCDPSRLRALLSGGLDAPAEEALAHHLDQCEHCQHALEALLSELSGVSLRESMDAKSETLRHVIDELEAATFSGDRHTELTLDFLEPSDDPDSLGKLGEYEVFEMIGRGGMGVVLRAFDARLNRFVAIKVLSPHLASSDHARRRFRREGRAAAAVRHDHVVAIHAVDEARGLPYLVMEFIEGSSLQEKIAREAPLPVEEILRIGLQTAAGLASAHDQGLVHRDIKPANILLENGVERVHITDFGLARATDDTTITRANVAAGTPQYMSPEQAHGAAVDHRSDLFSLGCVLYEMATGRSPFRADSTAATIRRVCEATPTCVSDLNSRLPQPLVDLISRLLSKDRASRPQTAVDVQHELEHYLAAIQRSPTAPLVYKPPATKTHKDLKMANRTIITIVTTMAVVFFLIVAAVAVPIVVYFWTFKTPIHAPIHAFDREFALTVQAGRGELDEATANELQAARNPILLQVSDPSTKPLIELFGRLPDALHAELLEQGYLKWNYADLPAELQTIYRNTLQTSLDLATQTGQPADPTMSLEALETAEVGFAVVSIDTTSKVVSWFIIFPNRPLPIWLTVVGQHAAGTPEYFQAHNFDLPLLRSKPTSTLP